MKRIHFSEPVLIGFLTFTILFLSLLPLFIKLFATPAGRSFIPVHNSLSDYPFYTAIIKQGLDGQWQVWGRFTAEPQERGGYVHFFYLLLGQVGRMFKITDAHGVYHAARIILGGIWLAVIYRFISAFVTTKRGRVTGFFLAAFSAGWPVLVPYNGKTTLWWPMVWWSELDPVARATFLPHYLLGHILMVVMFLLSMSISRRVTARKAVALSVIGWITGFIHPPSLMIVILTVPLWFCLQRKWREMLVSVAALFFAASSALVIKREFAVFPWTLSQSFEGLSFALNIREYHLALGPVLPLSVVGAVWQRKNRDSWLLVLWVVLSVIMLDLVRYFPFSPFAFVRALAVANTRFLQVAVWVPLAVLGAWGLEAVYRKFGRIAFTVFLIVLAVLTFAGYPQAIRFQSQKVFGAADFSYPTKGFMDAIMYLRDVVKPDETVWSLPLAGQIIPSYINRVVYTGNELFYTKDLDFKMRTSWGLYHGDLSPCDAYRLMKQYRVKAVFYGFDEQHAAGDPAGVGTTLRKFPFLLPWKRFDTTSVYLFTDTPPTGCMDG